MAVSLVVLGNRHSSRASALSYRHILQLVFFFLFLFYYFGFFLSAGVGAEQLLIVGQGPTVLAVGASRSCSDNFLVSPIVSLFFLPLSGRRLDRLRYCLKQPFYLK